MDPQAWELVDISGSISQYNCAEESCHFDILILILILIYHPKLGDIVGQYYNMIVLTKVVILISHLKLRPKKRFQLSKTKTIVKCVIPGFNITTFVYLCTPTVQRNQVRDWVIVLITTSLFGLRVEKTRRVMIWSFPLNKLPVPTYDDLLCIICAYCSRNEMRPP